VIYKQKEEQVGQRLKTANDCPTDDLPALEVTGTPVPYNNTTTKAKAANRSNRTVHEVKEGDTLGSIAEKYNIKLADLLKLNNFERGEIIFPKMLIYVN